VAAHSSKTVEAISSETDQQVRVEKPIVPENRAQEESSPTEKTTEPEADEVSSHDAAKPLASEAIVPEPQHTKTEPAAESAAPKTKKRPSALKKQSVKAKSKRSAAVAKTTAGGAKRKGNGASKGDKMDSAADAEKIATIPIRKKSARRGIRLKT
jgi:hypothetical protein